MTQSKSTNGVYEPNRLVKSLAIVAFLLGIAVLHALEALDRLLTWRRETA